MGEAKKLEWGEGESGGLFCRRRKRRPAERPMESRRNPIEEGDKLWRDMRCAD